MFKYKTRKINNQYLVLSIKEQSERLRRSEDGLITTESDWMLLYRASNGWEIRTAVCPEIKHDKKIIFIRGKNKDLDEKEVFLPIKFQKEVEQALKEFKMHLGDCSITLDNNLFQL